MDGSWICLVALSSLHSIWPLPIGKNVALVSGGVLLVAGCTLLLAGIIEFRSLRRVSGMETTKLIATGI